MTSHLYRVWTLNPDIFFIGWRNKIEPSSLPWKVEQDANFARFTTHAVFPIFPEESWVLDWIGIRVDVEIFESAEKKLRIQKYPDMCGRALRRPRNYPTTATKTSLKKYPASRGFSLVFLSVVLPFSSRFWLLAFCSGKGKESCFLVFTSSTKREIRHFHVVFMQRRQKMFKKEWCTCKVVLLI